MPRTTADGLEIVYDDAGGGEPACLALPGWCDRRAVFRNLIPELSPPHRVLAVDWRGHGQSAAPPNDFAAADLVSDAMAVIAQSGARQVVPLAVSHAGWIAIELRRRLGAERVPRIVLLDWIVLDAPAPFLDALRGLQDPRHWQAVRNRLFAMWLGEKEQPAVERHIREHMGAYGPDMWARAGREIALAYSRWGSPLAALRELDPPVPALHLYAQPRDEGYLAAQRSFADANPWFQVRRLDGTTHFPTLEMPGALAAAVNEFLGPSELRATG